MLITRGLQLFLNTCGFSHQWNWGVSFIIRSVGQIVGSDNCFGLHPAGGCDLEDLKKRQNVKLIKSEECKRTLKLNSAKIKTETHMLSSVSQNSWPAKTLHIYDHKCWPETSSFLLANRVTPQFYRAKQKSLKLLQHSRVNIILLCTQLRCGTTLIFLMSQVVNTCFFWVRPALSVPYE